MPERLQPLVRRDRRPQGRARRARQPAGRLLPEEAEEVGRALEIAPLRRIGEGDHAAHQSGHHGVDAGLEERDPDRGAEHEVDRAEVDAGGADEKDAAEQADPDQKLRHRDVAAVGDRDHEQRDDVVDDRNCEQIGAQPVGEARPHEGEQAERERGVGRHRCSPAVGRAVAGVDREIDRDRHHHPTDAGQEGQRNSPPLAQLTEVELAPRLEPDHEEEEGHQARVDPAAQVLRDPRTPDPDRERRRPDAFVRREVGVRPEERRDDAGEEDGGASRLRTEEGAQRALQAARPRGPSGERGRGEVRVGHRASFANAVGSTEERGPGSDKVPVLCGRRQAAPRDLYPGETQWPTRATARTRARSSRSRASCSTPSSPTGSPRSTTRSASPCPRTAARAS